MNCNSYFRVDAALRAAGRRPASNVLYVWIWLSERKMEKKKNATYAIPKLAADVGGNIY